MNTQELITLQDAAARSERSVATLRRWLRQGKLTRHESQPPAHGGSGRVLVDSKELLTLLAASGQPPRTEGVVEVSNGVGETGDQPDQGVSTEPEPEPVSLRVLRLEGELALSDARATIATITGERDSLATQLELHRKNTQATFTQLAENLNQMRTEVTEWKERHDALYSENKALRKLSASQGAPWYRRLLGGPVAIEGPQ